MAASLYRVTTVGWLPYMGVHIALVVSLWVLTLFRNRVPYVFRASFLVTLFVTAGVASLWQHGLLGAGQTFAVMAPGIAVMLFGVRVGIFVLIGSISMGAAIGIWSVSVSRLPTYDPLVYALQPSSWVALILGWLLEAAGLLAAIVMYNKGLFQALHDANRHEEELRKSEERFRRLVENSPNPVCLKNLQGHYLMVNEQFETLVGKSREDIIGKTVAEIFPGPLAESGAYHDQETIERKNALEIDELFDRGDRKFNLVTTRFPILGMNGEVVSLAAVHVDITARKLAEQELATLNAELEQRVEARTEELRKAQEELIKSERLATLGQLTATVSHELRNPLGAMRTSMYVVGQRIIEGDEKLKTTIERVNRNITRCDRIIDELLDYTRISDLELVPTEVDKWLGDLLDEQVVPVGVVIERQFDANEIRISLDRDRLCRAVINIFENACHAATDTSSPNKPDFLPLVVVETRLRDDRLEIAVSDNGPGIAKEDREKIFEPLFSTKSFGVGLGLPIAQQIIREHGGEIMVSPGRSGGTRFTLSLPLARQVVEDNA